MILNFWVTLFSSLCFATLVDCVGFNSLLLIFSYFSLLCFALRF